MKVDILFDAIGKVDDITSHAKNYKSRTENKLGL